jgi:hypothetical protein
MLERTPMYRQPNFSGRGTIGQGSSQSASTGGDSSRSKNQVSTLRGGSSSTKFRMEGHGPTIRLPEFRGEASEDPQKNYSSTRRSRKQRRSHMIIQNVHNYISH